MISSLWNGVIGIHTHDRALNVVANNSTNVNDYGYKPDEVSFTDMMYNANGVGKGSQISSVHKVFNQGEILLTSNPYDVAIEGSGFFVVEDKNTNELFYTRAGNFQMGDDGLLQSADGTMKVLGLPQDAPTIISTNAAVNEFNDDYTDFIASVFVNSNTDFYQSINARTTDYKSSADEYGTSGDNYKSSSSLITDIDKLIVDYRSKLETYANHADDPAVASTTQITKLDFGSSMSLLTNENDFITVTIDNAIIKQQFDTDIETTLKKFSDKISKLEAITSSVDTTTGELTIETMVPGSDMSVSDGAINDKAVYEYTTQEASTGSGLGMVNSSRDALVQALEHAGAEFLEIQNNISLTNQENLAALDTIQLKLENLSLSENTFGVITIEENGSVFLADGQNKFLVGKIQTVAFRAEQDLNPVGSNLFAATELSGDPYYAKDINKIIYNSLELSAANLADSLSKILTLQRAFEANAKSITTSDELLKAAIALRK